MKILKCVDPIFHTTLIVARDCEYTEAVDLFCKKYPGVDKESALGIVVCDDTGGVSFVDGTCALIWLKNKDLNTTLHESFHCTIGLLNNKGLRLSDESEEAYAYFIEWIFNCCVR